MTGNGAAVMSAVASAASTALLVRPAMWERASKVLGVSSRRKVSLSPTRIVQLCCVAVGLVFFGGTTGLVAGIGAAALAPSGMNRLQRRADVERRELVARQFPVVCDLLAVAMAAGRPPQVALSEVAAAVHDPVAGELAVVADRMSLSADAIDAWDGIDPDLGEIGRVIRRCEHSGTPIAQVLHRSADEQRRSLRAQIQHKVQRISVRTAAPLGMCFLPAFFLVGVCPSLIGSVSQILP